MLRCVAESQLCVRLLLNDRATELRRGRDFLDSALISGYKHPLLYVVETLIDRGLKNWATYCTLPPCKNIRSKLLRVAETKGD